MERPNIEMKLIEGSNGKVFITPTGQVWSDNINDFLKPWDNNNGYLYVDVGGKHRRINRLVALAYVPKPDNWTPAMDVAHDDDNTYNNHYTNLFWRTRAENLDTDSFRQKAKQKIRSKVMCVETGEIYPSIAAAGRAIGKHKYGINLCLLGKQETCGGYHWRRVEENKI